MPGAAKTIADYFRKGKSKDEEEEEKKSARKDALSSIITKSLKREQKRGR